MGRGDISLGEIISVAQNPASKSRFIIKMKARSFIFEAPTELDSQNWVDAIVQAKHNLDEDFKIKSGLIYQFIFFFINHTNSIYL